MRVEAWQLGLRPPRATIHVLPGRGASRPSLSILDVSCGIRSRNVAGARRIYEEEACIDIRESLHVCVITAIHDSRLMDARVKKCD